MKRFRSNKAIVLAGCALIAAVAVGVAVATVAPTVFADTNAVRERIVRTQFTPSEDQPIFNSGWHTHPGPIIIQVEEGYLKFFREGMCEPTIIGAGETYIEVPELPLLAKTKVATRWTATGILPNSTPGTPDRAPADNPCD